MINQSMLSDGRVVFDCPVCGAHHDGPLDVTVEAETIDVGYHWEPVSGFVRQTFRTSACRDMFVTRSIIDTEPTYAVKMLTYSDDRPTELHVKPRVPLAEAVRRGRDARD